MDGWIYEISLVPKYIWVNKKVTYYTILSILCSFLSVPPCRAHVKLDINAQSIMGRTALHDSITVGHKEVVKLLLKGGANVNLAYNPDQVSMIDRGCHGNSVHKCNRVPK